MPWCPYVETHGPRRKNQAWRKPQLNKYRTLTWINDDCYWHTVGRTMNSMGIHVLPLTHFHVLRYTSLNHHLAMVLSVYSHMSSLIMIIINAKYCFCQDWMQDGYIRSIISCHTQTSAFWPFWNNIHVHYHVLILFLDPGGFWTRKALTPTCQPNWLFVITIVSTISFRL